MCGIVGLLLSKNHVADLDSKYINIVEKILDNQTYRGPDHRGLEIITTKNNHVILGHNRLSIIDLNVHANQPMWDESKRYCIVYNGMIYNYQKIRIELMQLGYTFISQSDTEIVLNAFKQWGINAFNRFNGMFAIVIYDTLEEKLHLVRDRFGIKPLYYAITQNQFYFASTSAELAKQLHLKPDLVAVATGLRSWCYEHEPNKTIYENLYKVAPAEVITVHFDKKVNLSSLFYYSLETQVENLIEKLSKNSFDTLIAKIENTLLDSVNLRLHSDVPIGVSLSGGIDSSTVASLAKKQLKNLTGFTFGNPKDPYSEGKMAARAAAHSGLNLNFIQPNAHEMQQAFLKALELQDAPFPNFSVVAQYLVFKAAKEHGIKVMLGGQGGDEVFMGYRKFLFFYLQHLLHKQKILPAVLFAAQLLPTVFKEIINIPNHLYNMRRYDGNTKINSFWSQLGERINLGINPSESLWKRQIRDIYQLSLPSLLRYEDRNSMGNSIESRLPFLDYRLVELALALPEATKLNRGFGKWILRNIASKYIPRRICFSRIKRGFDVDNSIWIKAGLGALLREKIKLNSSLLQDMNLSNQVDAVFSDKQLLINKNSLAEAITLTWLSTKI